jgi:hypothetical protein
MRKILVALALSASIAASGATAQTAAPDMKGTWMGTAEAIVTGKTKHHAPRQSGKPMLSTVQLTYVISGQDGHRFWGTLSSVHSKEMLTGVVGLDGKTVVLRISEGEARGTLVDPDTMQVIYSAGGPASVVAVNTIRRQK